MEGTKYLTKEAVLKRGQEIIGIPMRDVDKTGWLSTGKGAIGTVIEESWYGYHPNSESEPDFPEAGVELKATPYVRGRNGQIRAKERLVCNIINYMEEVEIQSELDQSAEGVKVATYHKSKGLQWKIVILNSLDDNELELADFVKKNWFGLNLKGDYGSAELQLIPNCGDVTDAVAEAVLALSKQTAGSDDNGYYNLRHGKVEGEIKRLLYVGATRARDYLITTSLPDGHGKTQPLA